MTYWNWVMLGRIAGEGDDEPYPAKMEVLAAYMNEIVVMMSALLVTTDFNEEDGMHAVEEAGCKFMTDIGYGEYAIEVATQLREG